MGIKLINLLIILDSRLHGNDGKKREIIGKCGNGVLVSKETKPTPAESLQKVGDDYRLTGFPLEFIPVPTGTPRSLKGSGYQTLTLTKS